MMNSLNKGSALLVLILHCALPLSVNAQAQKFNHQFLSVEDGLASRDVLCGLQDRRGFLWFGTRNGLNRYDGKHFTLLTKRNGLQRNRVVNLAEDKEGNLWIAYGNEEGTYGTDGKTDIYNPVTGELMPLENKFPDVPFEEENINWMVPNKQGDIYFLVRNALVYRYREGKGFEQVVDATEDMDKLKIESNYNPNANGEGIAFNERYTFFSNRFIDNNKFLHTLSYFNEEGLLEYVSVDKKSRTPQLSIKKNTLDGGLIKEYLPCDSLTFTVLNNLDFIWGHWNDKYGPSIILPLKMGLFVFKNYKCTPLATAPYTDKGFSSNLSFFSDRQDNYWVCTSGGLHKFTPVAKRFQVLFNKAAFNTQDLLGNQMRAIFADTAGNVWAGGHFGLAYYHKADGKYYSMLSTNDDAWIHCFYKRDDKIYYFGSGLSYIGLPNLVISGDYEHKLNLSPESYLSTIGFIWAVFPLSGQRYLLGNNLGNILVWNIRENSFSQVEPCQQSMPFSNYIYRIIFSPKDQHYWAVGGSGCYRISKDFCITDYYGTGNGLDEEHRIPVSDLRDIYEDPEGIFWLATNGEGLLRWDRESGNFQSFTIQDGMPSNTLYCLLPDEFGNLWVSTDNGLLRFNKSTHYINVFSTKDGIANDEFNRVSSFKGADGTMYFGGIDGMTVFHPRDFEKDTSAQQIPLQVTGFYQFLGSKNKLTDLTHQLLTKQEIVLHPGDKFFSLEFALLDFRFPVNHYKYQIEGFDKEWQYTPEPLLRLSGLPYGNCTLRIAGQSYSGAWSKQELVIPVHVVRPFYLKWWSFSLYGLAFLFILYLFRKYQIRRLLEKTDKVRLQEIDSLKTKLYTNITHEFRTPLTVIKGMAEQLAEEGGHWATDSRQDAQSKDGMLAKIQDRTNFILRNAGSLLRLINQMLDLSKMDSGKLSILWELGDVVLFLQYLSESFHSFAATKDIQLTYYPEVKSLEMDYDREKLQQIISNLLSNAIKFTPEGGKVVFHVAEIPSSSDFADHLLQIKVSNSGIGISTDHLANIFDRFYQVDDSNTRKSDGTGIGLALTKELVELMGGSISVKSEHGKGAEFIVLLPVRKTAARSLDLPQIETAIPASGLKMDEPVTSSLKTGELLTDENPLLLLIEDNADVATYIRTCLENKYTVLWAKNGQLGIDKALETVPDIIISDVMMPVKDGYEVTQFLKNDERTSHIPIILLTAKAGISSRITGLERGADVYLSKPFDKKELLVHVEKLIELRRKLQARYAGEATFSLSKAAIREPGPTDKKAVQIEDAFLKKVNEILEKHLSNSEFEVPQLSREVLMSQSQIYRKIKALTGKSIVAYLRSYRLHKGRELLRTSAKNISEVAYEVGFSDPAYFSRLFSKEFGVPPMESRK